MSDLSCKYIEKRSLNFAQLLDFIGHFSLKLTLKNFEVLTYVNFLYCLLKI